MNNSILNQTLGITSITRIKTITRIRQTFSLQMVKTIQLLTIVHQIKKVRNLQDMDHRHLRMDSIFSEAVLSRMDQANHNMQHQTNQLSRVASMI